jgi:hypothetical protein
MTNKRRFYATCILIAAALVLQLGITALQASSAAEENPNPNHSPVIWTDRGDVQALDMIGGPGGREHQPPSGKFVFVEEDMKGTSPKFVVRDEQGVRWKVKLGQEVKSETAAARLVWAAGYFTDEDYYLPELHVENLPKLKRGSEFASADGTVRDVRMERHLKEVKKAGNWSWFKNPFTGTRELNGLRIMMALINNWDW